MSIDLTRPADPSPVASPALPAAPAAGQAPSSSKAQQLKMLAAQFESLLLGEMLKGMRSSFDDDADKDTGFGGSPLGDALDSSLSVALAGAGGMGLGQSLLPSLLQQANSDGTSDVPSLPSSLLMSTGSVSAAPSMDMPLLVPSGRISSAYGWRKDPIDGSTKFHSGVDVAMPEGQAVTAAGAGQVTFAGEQSGYGLTVMIDHGNGVTTRYAHLSEIDVHAGDSVASGQAIAKSGSTGRSTGPHLHFEVLQGGQAVAPE